MSESNSASQDPSGVQQLPTPNYINPPDHYGQDTSLHIVVVILTTTLIGLRLYTRFSITHTPGWDDFCAMLAWAISLTWSALLLVARNYGIGRHIWDIPPENLIEGLKYIYIVQQLYFPLCLSIKLSFLLFYLRIFGVRTRVKRFIWIGIVTNSIFYFITFFCSVFLCRPVAASWDPRISGSCGPLLPLPYVTGIFGFLGDIYILLVPIPVIVGLQMNTGKRLRLLLVFSIGLLACSASIARFAFTVSQLTDNDLTWSYSQLSLWAVLEVNVGIICSCFLALPALLINYKEKWLAFTRSLTLYRSTRSESTLKLESFESKRQKSARNFERQKLSGPENSRDFEMCDTRRLRGDVMRDGVL